MKKNLLNRFRYVYGPVPSWRLGVSLGVDPLGDGEKVCNFDCVYCQLGPSRVLTTKRGLWVEAADLKDELQRFPFRDAVDVVTFSGRGEPTLAENLGELIETARRVTAKPIALITNASLIHDPDVAAAMSRADIVMAKLDAMDPDVFERVDKPAVLGRPEALVEGLIRFRQRFKGRLSLQMMFIDDNKHQAPLLAEAARYIGPDWVEINTPTRPCGRRPLSCDDLKTIKTAFNGLVCMSVDEHGPPDVVAWDDQAAKRRHGRYDRSQRSLMMGKAGG